VPFGYCDLGDWPDSGLFALLYVTDTAIEMLNSVVICLENTGAPTRRNQAGSPFRPVAVG